MSYLQTIRELEEQHRLLPSEAESQSASTLGYELDEKDELSPTPTDCRACLCSDYSIRLRESCGICQGALCGCGGCLRASRAWRYADREPPTPDLPLPDLLERLRKGSRWLEAEHTKWYAGEPSDDKLRSKMSSVWDEQEEALRHTGFEGCIFGEGEQCPEDAPLRCSVCAGSLDSQKKNPIEGP